MFLNWGRQVLLTTPRASENPSVITSHCTGCKGFAFLGCPVRPASGLPVGFALDDDHRVHRSVRSKH